MTRTNSLPLIRPCLSYLVGIIVPVSSTGQFHQHRGGDNQKCSSDGDDGGPGARRINQPGLRYLPHSPGHRLPGDPQHLRHPIHPAMGERGGQGTGIPSPVVLRQQVTDGLQPLFIDRQLHGSCPLGRKISSNRTYYNPFVR